MSNPYETPQSSGMTSPGITRPEDEGKGKALASLILGLLSIFGWILPIVGIPLTVTGLVLGIKGLGPQKRGTAITGIVLSVLFLVASLLNAAAGIYLAVNGQHPLVQ